MGKKEGYFLKNEPKKFKMLSKSVAFLGVAAVVPLLHKSENADAMIGWAGRNISDRIKSLCGNFGGAVGGTVRGTGIWNVPQSNLGRPSQSYLNPQRGGGELVFKVELAVQVMEISKFQK